MAVTCRLEAEKLAEIARRQHGLVTREQLLGAGMSNDTIRRRVAAGALARTGAHVFAIAGAPTTWEQRALAACLDRGATAVVSHLSAARALQLEVPGDARIHITVPHDRLSTLPRAGVVLHRTRVLDASDTRRVGSIPVTSVTRTLVDLATMLGPATLARAADDALSRRLVTPDHLRDACERLAARRHGGSRGLGDLLELWCSEQTMESVAEARVLRAIAGAGLPPPRRQMVVSDVDGLIGGWTSRGPSRWWCWRSTASVTTPTPAHMARTRSGRTA